MEVMKLENTTEYFFSFKIGEVECATLWLFTGKDIDLIGVGRTK